jgi:putative Mg2+ transporter-C (MgtC) family protein
MQLRMLADVALAMVLGSLIGLEREVARKAAGLRTHMLVAGAAAMLVEGARGLLDQFVLPGVSPLVRFDPVPLITAVVTAVGFLGAGTIIRGQGEHVEGLTTAASMLFAATVGASAALREYWLACGATLLALVTLRGVRWIETRIARRRKGPGPGV